jgi:hypothetical protein
LLFPLIWGHLLFSSAETQWCKQICPWNVRKEGGELRKAEAPGKPENLPEVDSHMPAVGKFLRAHQATDNLALSHHPSAMS